MRKPHYWDADELVEALIQAIKDLRASMGMPGSLKEFGVTEEKFRSNIDEVAKLAGVSTATVSHVCNNTRFVSDDLKKKVFDAMEKLHSFGLADVIKEVVNQKKPLLGICLGLQLLYERSQESDGVEGLGILKGKILRIPDCEGLKIPHMGWNSLEIKPGAKLFKGIENQSYVYFVHSYYLKADNKDEIAATTNYSTVIHASVEKDNIYACQFHPEKSGEVGLKILKNFAEL